MAAPLVAAPAASIARTPSQPAEVQLRLGQVWRRQGKLRQAQVSYQKAVDADPHLAAAWTELGGVLREQGCLDEAVQVFRRGLALNPNTAELHKALVDALVQSEGLAAAYAYYQLDRVDDKPIALRPDAILGCSAVRNEVARLPYFLSYYRSLGVDCFLIVDNGSTDGTLAYLLAQPDVHVWRSTLSFNQANFGAGWFEILLRHYGVGHWCLIVDADEALVYDGCEQRALPDVCRALDQQGKRVMSGLLLDMYGDRPIQATHTTPGQPFLDVCPYFDRQAYHAQYENWTVYRNQTVYFGGVRQRVFGEAGQYILSKVPLIRYDVDCILMGGQHWTNRPAVEIAADTACLLHFKYFSTFPDYARQEVARQEHYGQAMQYAEYARRLAEDNALTLYDPQHSIRYRDSQQLVELGVIQPLPRSTPTVEFPPIPPVSSDTRRPFWSVMLTAYNRLHTLPRALRSVLDQAPDPAEMQIEVVNDGADADTQARLASLVHDIGGDRVSFYRQPVNVGHPHIFNVCIARARGQWVHILHDDDWVAPGFYAALEAGIGGAPDLGAAFCRHHRVDEAGAVQWTSPLERDTPGRLDDWLARIAVTCRLQFASIVVRRAAYETVGGFCAAAGSAFDWEMWQRLAVHFPVWYEPQPLAFFCQGASSLTHRLVQTGEQIAHARQAIEIAAAYLPADRAANLGQRARQHYATYALQVAETQWQAGDTAAAIANLQEGLKCRPDADLARRLTVLLLYLEREGS
ncbi:MAG: glycosyltransferase family 2 protein [Anaerolineae bacterium]|nr:glycosyltransferase family 2 protein [Anaerolineae bacterium]